MNDRAPDAGMVKTQIYDLLRQHPELFEDDEALALSLESETDAISLCTRMVDKLKRIEAHQAGIKLYVKELNSRVELLESRSEAIRRMLLSILEASGLKKLQLSIATVSTMMSRRVIIVEPELIPQDLRRQPPWEPLKADIRSKLYHGEDVPGCTLSNLEPHLTVRMK